MKLLLAAVYLGLVIWLAIYLRRRALDDVLAEDREDTCQK